MQPPPTRLASLTLLALCAAACGDATSADETGITTGIDSASVGTSAPTTGSATEDPEPPFVPIVARGGLEIDWIEANQGVGVAIGRDGAGVGGADRTSYLIQDRVTLIRAFWKDPPADWVPREIEGRLTIKYPDGTSLVQSSTPLIDGPSFIGNLDHSFYWGLKKEQVVPGITFNVELYETAAGQEELPAGVNPPRLPHTGSAPVGIENSDQVLKITLVPFNYDSGDGCKTTAPTDDATMQVFKDQMYMMNPIDRLDFTVHAPVDWPTKLDGFNPLNEYMSGLRADEGAEPERYYFGLIDVCSGELGGYGGYAYGIPQGGKATDAYLRVSTGLWYELQFSSETFVHEVGHTQGRYHVRCNGMEGGPDNSYPTYPDEGQTHGEIHDWGFGVLDFKLYHPTVHRDYMTYCHPVWASSWGWNKVYPVIEALSSLDDAGPSKPPGDDAVLVGSVYPDGRESWISVPGAVNSEDISAVHGVEFTIDGETVPQPAALLTQPEGEVVLVVTELPRRWDAVTAMTRVAGPQRIAVPLTSIRHHHQRRLAAAK